MMDDVFAEVLPGDKVDKRHPSGRPASIAIHSAFGTQILLGITTVMTGVSLIAVVLDSPDMYTDAKRLLDDPAVRAAFGAIRPTKIILVEATSDQDMSLFESQNGAASIGASCIVWRSR